ncbi:hypothetical protein BCF44_107443 [Kutzneria buriramensis]|uniref:Uncharacterized protein n=1 Tax=Kutzneria buriramensis TaxID=1045776 RepID=A0A3E0HIY9_9PSEU|nr:hypothetical protein BCF44_107443 [Kutzneria buriramensis]
MAALAPRIHDVVDQVPHADHEFFHRCPLRPWLGAQVAERFREAAERLAGVVLVVTGIVLALEELPG